MDDGAKGGGAVLAVEAASYAYADRKALDRVDLAIEGHAIYALLGPNGAGKTTLVRAISGRIAPDRGSVRIAGGDPFRSGATRRRIGLVPQRIALYPALSARQNLRVFARLMGVAGPRAVEAADRALALVGLAERARDRVGTLSGGMQRRLNIAAAIMHEPALLILDEPTVGVDPRAKESIHDLLLELRARGLAILLTTHDMEQATEIADRVGIIAEGRLRVQGTPAELVDRAYGADRELVIAFEAPPSEAQAALLHEAGLAPLRGTRVWAGRFPGDYERVAQFDRALTAAGPGLSEIALREPTLTGVFHRLAGEELTL